LVIYDVINLSCRKSASKKTKAYFTNKRPFHEVGISFSGQKISPNLDDDGLPFIGSRISEGGLIYYYYYYFYL
jgi:hypothetical protein